MPQLARLWVRQPSPTMMTASGAPDLTPRKHPICRPNDLEAFLPSF
jgi:hypothetical protein